MFVSAGNIEAQDLRPEWPEDIAAALANLASARNDALLTPAESARNVAVAALNPPGHGGCLAHAPARFSRRGPGLRAGVKPDLAHIGGRSEEHTSELQSLMRNSYAVFCLKKKKSYNSVY